ncbi:ABC transporter permease [Acetobacterium woodii]|uniref:ABC transport system permease protein n=1 Tax=Acetobacterium woodii (strain ATCC 29683 / DSM 1030 / JCM 2381 / KCTC 1655 / WB1) TaxID=931626 RepID=H6LF30_ACEWD|nr:FtsX-like permease family protein [Acetobacterium woodii]AFA46936.1 ABC transport system permease protein [Acetobacterium woodii DSM 1030]
MKKTKLRNNNQGIIRHLALRSLKTNKMRNLFILLTIALSVSLLVVMALFTSAQGVELKKQVAMMQHVTYMNVNKDQISALEDQKQIEFMTLDKLGQGFERNGVMLQPTYYEERTGPIKSNPVIEGTYPHKVDEIAVNKSVMAVLGVPATIGATVPLTFLDGETETFIVSGFLAGNEVAKVYPILFSREYAEQGPQLKDIPYHALCRIRGAETMSELEFLSTIRDIGAAAGIERKNINENNYFSNSLTMSTRDIFVVGAVGLGILLVSILVIYSIFYLSVIGRIRQFGQLRTLGATKKQIKSLVSCEGVILCIIGSTVGFLIAWPIAYYIKPQGWSWGYTLILSLLIFVADLITVLVSIRRPANLAASVTSIEASLFSEYHQNPKKEAKKIQRKMTPIHLALMSTQRNRKRFLLTMISLGIGGVLFISGATFIGSMTAEDYSRQGFYQWGEYIISYDCNATQTTEHGNVGIQLNNPLNPEFIENIKAIDGVTAVRSFNKAQISYDYKDQTNNQDSLAPFTRENQENVRDVLEEGSFDYDEMIAKDEVLIVNNPVAKEIFGWKFAVGDTVKLHYFNGTEEVERDFTVVGAMDTYSEVTYNAGWFVIPQEKLAQLFPGVDTTETLVVTVADFALQGDAIEPQIRNMVDQNPLLALDTLREELILDATSFTLTNKVILGLAIFIIAFSLINLVNTLITNIVSRQQEFSMLQSIGMTNRQLTKMIQAEGLILALGNLIITLILGTGAGYGLVYWLRQMGATYMHYRFPTGYFVGYILVTLLVPIVVSGVLVRLFQGTSLVERLRAMV